jgi:hypothetical protein
MDGCSLPSSVRVELDNLAKQTLEDIFSVTDDDDNQLFIHRSCIYLIVEACAATYGTVQEENYYSLFRRLRERRPNFIQHLVNCMCTADQSVLKWLIKELSSHVCLINIICASF